MKTRANRLVSMLLAGALCLSLLAACAPKKKELTRYSTIFYDVFDTVTQVIAYCESEEVFKTQMDALHADLVTYNQLYDIYNDYPGVTNVKTINDNAGKAPVEVDDRILSMLELADQMYATTNGKLNIAMGSVLNIWHNYREAAEATETDADNKLPGMDELEAAAQHCDINNVIIDEDAKTVYLADPDMRLDVGSYNLEELTEATEYYRDKANALALQVNRDGSGNVAFADFDALAGKAGEGFQTLTYDYFYPIFAGSTLPVKKLGWADMYSSMGITGVTFGLTGEACVNPQIPGVSLPFTMCHEMAHRMCIAPERDANFAAFLAASVHSDPEFQYSAYFMAFRYCYSALSSVNNQSAAAAAARVSAGVNDNLKFDMAAYNSFFNSRKSTAATNLADAANDTYLKVSGDESGVASYGEVCDLLVNWHIQTVVLPSITVEESPFDPYDETQVDLSGIVNAR